MGWGYQRATGLCFGFVLALSVQAVEPLSLRYTASWRLIHAGDVELQIQDTTASGTPSYEAQLRLQSVGVVETLYNVDDHYAVTFDGQYCASSSLFMLRERGKRRRIAVTYQEPPGTASFLEQDLRKNEVVEQKEIDVPVCVHDELAALARIRTMALEPGQRVDLPVSNGKKYAAVRVDVLNREEIKTPSGTYDTVRYEAFLYNDVIHRRKARLYFWLTDDDRRLPVQIRVKLGALLGTVTLKLEEEKST